MPPSTNRAQDAGPREVSQLRGLILQVDEAIAAFREIGQLADRIAGEVPQSDEGDAVLGSGALADELADKANRLRRARHDAASALERIQGVLS